MKTTLLTEDRELEEYGGLWKNVAIFKTGVVYGFGVYRTEHEAQQAIKETLKEMRSTYFSHGQDYISHRNCDLITAFPIPTGGRSK